MAEMNLPVPPKPRLLERFTDACRTRHLSIHTERSYWSVVRRFVRYTAAKSEAALVEDAPAKMARFLTAEARRDVAASTQNVAFNALVFLYEKVLGESLGELPEIPRAKRPARLPEVPATHEAALAVVQAVEGDLGLALRVIYGCALRVMDCLRLRLKDMDFERGEILIRASKGDKDRLVPLPKSLAAELERLVRRREAQHRADSLAGEGWVHLPHRLGVKYPKKHFETGWQYLFAAKTISVDPVTRNRGRHHLAPEAVQIAMKQAQVRLGIKKRFTPHGLRHAAARRAEENGTPISEIQKWLGHSDVQTTMRYLGQGEGALPKVRGPLE